MGLRESKESKEKDIENLKKSWIASNKSEIEILDSLRLGTDDYDFETVNLIKKGG